jgi:hypothetical protein
LCLSGTWVSTICTLAGVGWLPSPWPIQPSILPRSMLARKPPAK